MQLIKFIGNEGYGLRPLIAKQCTDMLYIPRATVNPSKDQSPRSISLDVESLNVAVASGILLYHLLRNKLTLFN